ncbi:MAG: L-histidine N(alpha)-methyltransferase, partial [Blastocatellia bacterium]|nr:L-histidine N(alpha)-methyltransferase [Blastocatellia bacterium]
MKASGRPELTQFADDVLRGLSSDPKWLSSRYFYDDEGSRLFMEIMKLAEYYPTRAELNVFTNYADEIHRAFTDGTDSFDLIELGAGDGSKTAVLIEHFLSKKIPFTYSPIDISQEANDALSTHFAEKFPDLQIEPHTGDYFDVLGSLKHEGDRRKILLFLGSNIGNFQRTRAVAFFSG